MRILALSIAFIWCCATANAEVLTCEALVRMKAERPSNWVFHENPQATAKEGWLATYWELLAVDAKGKIGARTRDVPAKLKVQPGEGAMALIAIRRPFPTYDKKTAVAQAKVYYRFIAERPFEFMGNKSVCTPEGGESVQVGKDAVIGFERVERDQIGNPYSLMTYNAAGKLLSVSKIEFQTDESIAAAAAAARPTPEQELVQTYQSYLIIDKCLAIGALLQSKDYFRARMVAIDKQAAQQGLNTGSLWERANREAQNDMAQWDRIVASSGTMRYQERQTTREICSLHAAGINEAASKSSPNSVKKKDF